MLEKVVKTVILGVVVAVLSFVCYIYYEIDNVKEETNVRNGLEWDIVQEDEISQWALDNDGLLPYTSIYSKDWEADVRLAQKGTDINFCGKTLKFHRRCIVAVIDTGVDIEHKDIRNIWVNEDELAGDQVDNDNNGYIDDYYGWNFCDDNDLIKSEEYDENVHGTHVVGILSASNKYYRGILIDPNYQIMCVRALHGVEGEGEIINLIEAIRYAEENGAVICNLSLTTFQYSEELKSVMKNSSMLFVVSAGNDGVEINEENMIYPISFGLNNVITVGNIRCDGMISKSSNYGAYIDVVAPGTDIISSFPNDSFGCLSGTSCATPYVTGLAAMVYSCSNEMLVASEIKNMVCENVKYNQKLEGYVKYGMVNYEKTFNSICN